MMSSMGQGCIHTQTGPPLKVFIGPTIINMSIIESHFLSLPNQARGKMVKDTARANIRKMELFIGQCTTKDNYPAERLVMTSMLNWIMQSQEVLLKLLQRLFTTTCDTGNMTTYMGTVLSVYQRHNSATMISSHDKTIILTYQQRTMPTKVTPPLPQQSISNHPMLKSSLLEGKCPSRVDPSIRQSTSGTCVACRKYFKGISRIWSLSCMK